MQPAGSLLARLAWALLSLLPYATVGSFLHSHLDMIAYGYCSEYVAQLQEEFFEQIAGRKLTLQQALARHAFVNQQATIVCGQAMKQTTGSFLLCLLAQAVSLYDWALSSWSHRSHLYTYLLGLVMVIGFLMPTVEVGDGWPQKLRRHVASSVGDEDGNNQLWSWQERQAFLSYLESSREPLMLLGVEMDARMLKVVAVMLVSAAISFVEFTERDDFPGKFSWDV